MLNGILIRWFDHVGETLDRVADMLGRICSHTISLGFGRILVVTCNDLYIETGGGLQVGILACRALQVGDGAMQLRPGFGRDKGPVICIASQLIYCPPFSTFMMNAHSMPESIRWSIIHET
jgi:hypothetical protein